MEQNSNEEILKYLLDIKNKIGELDEKISIQETRLNKLEGGGQVTAQIKIENPVTSIPTPPPAPETKNQFSAEDFQTLKQMGNIEQKKNSGDLEQNIGGKWFARIGIAALLIGVSFFLKYAFDNNWIGPIGRVAIGIFFGLALLALGEKTIRKYSNYGQIISGGGIGILYLSVFASFGFYNLINQPVAFLFMSLVTACGIALCLRYDAVSLFLVSIVGGFLTPILLSTGINNQFGLFSYIVLLDLAILFVSFFKQWRTIQVVGFIGTVLLFFSWSTKFYTNDQMFSTLFFLTAFFLIYSISSIIYNLWKKEKSSGAEQILTMFSAIFYFAAAYAILNPQYHSVTGFFAITMGIYYFLWAYVIKNITPDDSDLYNFLAFLTVGFVTIAIPIQFKQNIITISWIVEAVVLLILGIKINKDSIKSFGIIVFAFATLRLLFFDLLFKWEYELVIFNKTFLTFIFAIAGAYLIMYIVGKFDYSSEESKKSFFQPKAIAILFLILANFFTIFSISREIVVHYNNQIDAARKENNRYLSDSLKYNYGKTSSDYGVNSSSKRISDIQNEKSIFLSLFWLIYSIILVTFGIWRKSKVLRVGGLILLLISILKLFFFDLWNLGTLYRIISSMSLGVVLLLISFIYQKYKDKIKEIITAD